MDNAVTQAWREIAARPEGPMAFRFYLQPAMAMLFAARDGFKDARNGRPAYFWAVLRGASDRGQLMRDGWKSVGRVAVLAMVMDLVYQLTVLHAVRPLQTIVVAVLLAIVPYVALRGPANRVLSRKFRRP